LRLLEIQLPIIAAYINEKSMKLLIHPPVDAERLTKIVAAADFMAVVNASSENEALGHIPDSDAFFGKMTPELLQVAGQLRWVQSPTASLEHYLFPELIEHQCMLSNMRGLFSDVIADHVFGFILSFARNFHQYLRNQQNGDWAPVGNEKMKQQEFLMGPCEVTPVDSSHIHLSDSTIGVVGAGFIGQEICRRAAAFGMRVLAVDPKCEEVPGIVDQVWQPDRLPELLAESDFVVIAAPHTPATFKLFSSEKFQQMKSTAYLINIGRGVIVDLDDLTTALQAGEIAGAGLDVAEIEPLPKDHPLWRMPNVIITPHVAAASPRISERHLETLLENIRQFVKGEPIKTLVDKEQWF
jgi:phosphoglycerate dehydrogenase-like enzyme